MRLRLLLRALLALVLFAPAAEAAEERRPNVIVILSDDQRAADLGVAGHPILRTPNLDALAERGTYFPNAFVTSASCTPSRTCILLGQYERRHGVTFGSESALTQAAFARSYPMLLKEAGYFVGYVGKNHTPIGQSKQGFGYSSGVMEAGFDYWYGGHGHLQFYPKRHHKIFRNATADTQIEILDQGVRHFLRPDPHSDFVAQAQQFLRARPDDQPFCLLVNFNVPHSAGTRSMRQLPSDPELYRTAYRDQIDAMPIPPTYIAQAEVTTLKIPPRVYSGERIPSYNYVKTPETLREHEVRECQTITGIDNLVGNIVAQLQQQKLADNTIIVFLSDHGIQHGEHGLGGKVLLYEESIRIPLIVYDPRLKREDRPRRVEQMALAIDIAPTLLDLCGLQVPEPMQGRTLAPLMRGEEIDWRDDFFLENMFMGQHYPRIEGVRSRAFKYLRYFDKARDQHHCHALTASIKGEPPIYEELYDLKQDPQERTNLAGDPKYAEVLDQLRRRCQTLVTEARGTRPPETHVRSMK